MTPFYPHKNNQQYLKDWLNVTVGENNKRVNQCLLISWQPPMEGWVKLNVDGSRDNELGTITAGGVIRNASRHWMQGFSLKKGVGGVLEAEL
ncbi:hypothetical protein ACOSQ2_029213 [Xanthoceras sorbifolium]